MEASSGYKDYVAGLMAGIATVITGHPFDTVKGEVDGGNPQAHAIVPSAAFGGAIISFILCPSELCRMQVQGIDSLIPKSTRFSWPLEQEGLTGMFQGGFATLLRESVGNAVFFSTYEYVRYCIHLQLKGASSGSESSQLIDVGVGIMSDGLGGIAYFLQFCSAVLPLDVAKTIIQSTPEKNHPRNPFSVLKLIYRRYGVGGCYAGLGSTLVRAFPSNAAAIVAWELSEKLLGIRDNR